MAAERLFGPAEARALWRRSPLPQPIDLPRLEAEFLAECCERKAGATVEAAKLRARYRTWCSVRQVEPLSSSAFGRAMTALGLERRKVSAIAYQGIRLRLTGALR